MTAMVALLVLGLILICLEVFVPGGVVGTLGALALAGSVVLAFRNTDFGPVWLLVALGSALISVLVAIRTVARTPLGRKLFLHASERGYSGADRSMDGLAGKAGKAVTDLRPAGIAEIEGRRIDVVTEGEYLARGTEIAVKSVEGNRIVVVSTELVTG
ncbi:MAG TPA: NfeD family protein [bacterium]|nr:NfeD family protein [bacterium]HPJ71805.1 NfeD family protein [bacterium]HPQ66071.1 NfeD family protein [bacterium]